MKQGIQIIKVLACTLFVLWTVCFSLNYLRCQCLQEPVFLWSETDRLQENCVRYYGWGLLAEVVHQEENAVHRLHTIKFYLFDQLLITSKAVQ